MESRINYIIVGVFVVLFTSGLLAFIFWLGKYGDADDYAYYRAYMTESVSGLSNEASVKYRGVEVGIVKEIEINPDNSEQVQLLLKVTKQTPVKKDMYVTLKFYGLTGLAFIEIGGGSKNSALITHQEDEIPIIKTGPSLYARINESLSDLTGKLSHTLQALDELLSKQNLNNVSQTLESLDVLLSKQNLNNVSEILQNAKELSIQLKSYQGEIHTLIKKGVDMENNIITASDEIATASKSITAVAGTLEKSINDGDYDLKEISAKSLEKFDELVDSLKLLTSEIEGAITSIKNSPRDLLFKQTEQRLGPGEHSQ